jgi:hypothetical protein
MGDDPNDEAGQPHSAEDQASAELSEEVPEEASGEGATPLGSSDDHSAAPGPHGLGPLPEADGEEDSPGLAPLEEDADG